MVEWAAGDVQKLSALAEKQILSAGNAESILKCKSASDAQLDAFRARVIRKIFIHPSQIGRFIGTKGTNIQAIEKSTDVYVHRVRDGTATLYGEDVSALDRAETSLADYTRHAKEIRQDSDSEEDDSDEESEKDSEEDGSEDRSELAGGRVLRCCDCGTKFIFSSGEESFFEGMGFEMPKRCEDCRAAKKARFGEGGGGCGDDDEFSHDGDDDEFSKDDSDEAEGDSDYY